jgi:hypothetical protein
MTIGLGLVERSGSEFLGIGREVSSSNDFDEDGLFLGWEGYSGC